MLELPLRTTLKNGTFVSLDRMHPQEEPLVRDLFNAIILEGQSYPQQVPLTEIEFAGWLTDRIFFVVRSGPAVLGAFYLKPNFPGRCSHTGNAGFVVQPHLRRQGIGRFMGEHMLALARQQGFEAIMLNLVFETNVASLSLWQSLGFAVIGKIPQAVKLADGVVDALMMHRTL
jgi:GNAT superfamily N-acetyltransferase